MGRTTRREFIAGSLAAAIASGNASKSWAQREGKNLTQIIAGTPLTDQYGETLKPAEIFKGQPYIVVEGFLHCTGQCPRIRGNLGDVRAALEEEAQQLDKEGNAKKAAALRNIPVLWIDVMPDALGTMPGDRNEPQACVEEAYKRGFWQDPAHAKNFPADEATRIKLAQAAFRSGDPKKPAGRLLHVAFPESQRAAVALQKSMGAHFNAFDPQSHGSRIALVGGDGTVLASPSGLVTTPMQKSALTEAITAAALGAVEQQLKTKGMSP